MSMTAETKVEHDPREKPGGAKHKPVPHVVRIVVVPNVAVSSSRESHGPGQHQGLTDQELEMAEKALKRIDAGEPTNRTSKASRSMFDVLKPTDIVVVGREPASVCEVRRTRQLLPHDDRNKDTVLRVWTNSDTVEYQCDREFEIVEVERANWNIYGAPRNPFEEERGRTPYKATEEKTTNASGQVKSVWRWTSGVVPASANNQQYKATFKIDGQLIDPDVVCGDPPPN